MPLIPESLIDEIQTRIDIAEVIGRYVPLKRAGRHFKANCPFHKEKTPSFMVNTEKQIFHCFGCGVGGNIFHFLMQHDRMTFPEAVRQMADHVGIHVPAEDASSGSDSPQALAALMDKVCHYFERMLQHPTVGKAARDYFGQRGVSESTRQLFRLGVAPKGWSRLITAATSTGVTAEQLEAAGLSIKGKRGHYDRFRHRVMFPILDLRGRVVGFGGRSLDGQEPKYLNSPETALYSKGRHLFGLAQAKDAIIKKKAAIVVEGYFDCVVLADAGLSHVVSPQGTALTLDQVRLLKRYAETVILAFDADAAGEQATLRGIDLLVAAGLHVRVAQLPQGVDPDECLRDYGRERFEQLLDRSLTLFDFLAETAERRHLSHAGGTRANEDKVKAAQFVLPTIAKVPDKMLQDEYVKLLADRLQLSELAVAQELKKAQPRANASTAVTTAPHGRVSVGSTASRGPEQLLTALVLDEPSRWRQAKEGISLDDITDAQLRRILETLCEFEAAGRPTTPAHVVSRLSDEGQAGLVTALVELAQTITAKEEAFRDCLQRIRTRSQERELTKLHDQIRMTERMGQGSDVQQLVIEYHRRRSAITRTAPRGLGQHEH